MGKRNVAFYITFLLRHKPEEIGLHMDGHGWVSVAELMDGINSQGRYLLDFAQLEEIVRTDNKGRFRFSDDRSRIKACQGHSIPWVTPELEYMAPPSFLYHGTTTAAVEQIISSGAIRKMQRHHVHLQENPSKAWQSATRWHLTPVVLKIDAQAMHRDGFVFGRTENEVWCTDVVPVAYVVEQITESWKCAEWNQCD